MLRGLDPLLSPELLYALALMGHEDRLALVDRNYPAYSPAPMPPLARRASGAPPGAASGRWVVRLDGVGHAEAARAIFTVLPIDSMLERPIAYMADPSADEPNEVQREVLLAAASVQGRAVGAEAVGRYDFYERAASAFVLVITGEARHFGNFLIAKGGIAAATMADRVRSP